MAQRNDQVFQLSLTEIAFTIVFILLLLLGWMVYRAEEAKNELALELTKINNAKALLAASAEIKRALEESIAKGGSTNPGDVITSLINQQKTQQEATILRQRVDELERQLSALSELKEMARKAGSGADQQALIEGELRSAMAFQQAVRKEMGGGKGQSKDLAANEVSSALRLKKALEREMQQRLGRDAIMDEAAAIELVTAAQAYAASQISGDSEQSVKKENANLRGQVAFLKGKLDARGGRDYPPCWAEEQTGRVQFLFSIEIVGEGLNITPAWPAGREADARALPAVVELLSPSSLSLSEFSKHMQGIDRDSKEKNCRHYVLIRNKVSQLDVFNRSRFAIENFFYKLELRS
jgi:hypothetical protein